MDATVAPADACRRPLSADEQQLARALGDELRRLRQAAGLTRAVAARRAELSTWQLGRLERAERRTRASTLARLATTYAQPPRDVLLHRQLVALAGPSLAPESDYAARVDRRRRRRAARRRAAARLRVL